MSHKRSEELIRQLQEAESKHLEGSFEEAARLYRQILGQHPELAKTAFNLGIVLNELARYLEAEAAFLHALSVQPDFPEAEVNRCFAIQEQGRITEAINGYSHLATHPDTAPHARFNLACLQLLTGDLTHGWEGYELRFSSLQPVARRHYDKPRWDGTMAPGIRLLVHAEQGYGDTIQMARFLPILAGHGMEVHLETTAPLVSLLETLSGLKSCFVRGTPLPEVDCQISIMSLPGLMGTTLENIPAAVPYLTAADNRTHFWKDLLPNTPHLRVGLAWTGRLDLPVNRKRSISPLLLEPLLDIPDVLFVSLQQDVTDAFSTDDPRIFSCSEHLHDFHDTAALITNLDLIITIDTAVAHLAGALGTPAWLLLPFVPDWRWLMDRDTSPWYPAMRLFRQPELGNWSAVIKQVQHDLHRCLHPVFFCYKPHADFTPPANLEKRLIPLLADASGVLAAGVSGTVTPDFSQADLLLFPYYLEHFTEHTSIAAMRSFVTTLPHFKGREDRHVFFSDHDSAARYHTGSFWYRASVTTANRDDLTLAVPYHTEDPTAYLHFNPDAIRYHTSFVGYIGVRRERAALLNGIIRENRLVCHFDAVDSFHGHQAEEVRQQRRIRYFEAMSESLTVLCPEGAGANSIRFFETLSMGRIPVLVSHALLPYQDRIDYDRFVIRISPRCMEKAGETLYNWLEHRTEEEIMVCCRLARSTWEQWFSPDVMGRVLLGELIRKHLQVASRAHHPESPSDGQTATAPCPNQLESFLISLAHGDLAGAKHALNSALVTDPCNPRLHNMRGLLAFRAGETETAESAFLDSLQYDHRCYETYMELGNFYQNTGRDEEAVARFFEATLVRPDSPESFLAAIPSLKNLGRHREVAHCRTKAEELGATNRNEHG